MIDNIHTVTHPLALHKLTQMRKPPENCPSRNFVQLMKELGTIMGCEVMRLIYEYQGLQMKNKLISTHRKLRDGSYLLKEYPVLPRKKPVIIPIMRSGLIMAEAFKDIIATTYTGHIGIMHLEGGIRRYLTSFPDESADSPVAEHEAGDQLKEIKRDYILIDPVIATGETASMAIQTVKEEMGISPSQIFFVSLIIGSDGDRRLRHEHPDVQFFTITTDEEMSDHTLIYGIGEVGSRLFRTNF